MRIENLRLERREDWARASATVRWEDSQRPKREIFFEAAGPLAADLACNPHAFLVAGLVPAMRHGERRIAIDAPICPDLRNGLLTNMKWLNTWYGVRYQPLMIESAPGLPPLNSRSQRRAGVFLSGGVDSLATLRANQLDYASSHPRRVQDCILVHGFDIGGVECLGDETAIFQQLQTAVEAIARDAKVTPVAIHTNIRHLDDDVNFWMYQFHGAALAAVAHTLHKRLERIYIAATSDIGILEPWGSHPAIDAHYGSSDLSLYHDSLTLTRLEKVRLIADWEVALHNLHVCTMNVPHTANCGQCEKCVRTMLELLAVGKLHSSDAFPTNDVSPDLLAQVPVDDNYPACWYQEVVEPLVVAGRPDLAKVIKKQLSQFSRLRARQDERDWRGVVKRLDRRCTGGLVYQIYRSLRARA